MVLKRETLGRKKKSGESRRIRLAGKPGFEPRFHDPESCVLPLDDFPAGPRIILEFLAFFNVPEGNSVTRYEIWKFRSGHRISGKLTGEGGDDNMGGSNEAKLGPA
jgi:hypothetical protein